MLTRKRMYRDLEKPLAMKCSKPMNVVRLCIHIKLYPVMYMNRLHYSYCYKQILLFLVQSVKSSKKKKLD